MGVLAFNWAEEGNNQLVLLMNRDNWENRVISGASWDGQILSGRCQDNNGTWLAISRKGRFAFLMSATLLLDNVLPDSGCELHPIEFVEGNMSIEDFFMHVSQHADGIQNGWPYSLIVADMASNLMVHMRKPDLHEPHLMRMEIVKFGLHTLSTYGLDSTHSSRDSTMRAYFNNKIGRLGNDQLPVPVDEIARGSTTTAVFLEKMPQQHPNPELGLQRFGTTSTTALAVKRTGEVKLFERYRGNDGEWHEHSFDLNIQ